MAQFMRVSRGLSHADTISTRKRRHRRHDRLRESVGAEEHDQHHHERKHPYDDQHVYDDEYVDYDDDDSERDDEHSALLQQPEEDTMALQRRKQQQQQQQQQNAANTERTKEEQTMTRHSRQGENSMVSVMGDAMNEVHRSSPLKLAMPAVDCSAEPLDVNWTRLRRRQQMGGTHEALTTTTDINISLRRFSGPEFASLPRVISRGSRSLNAHRHGYTRQYLRNLFHTFINWPWWRIFLLGSLLYLLSFLVFACVYMIRLRSDADCLVNVVTFRDSFFFSMETQMTIGYGFRYVISLELSPEPLEPLELSSLFHP
jgi:Inward rectifier potassium channel transmembrane domain